MSQHTYGGQTLAQLKELAPLAATANGLSVSGPNRKVTAMFAAASALVDLVAAVETVTEHRDELLAALKQLEISANTVSGCYTRNPANFASALRLMEDAAETARTTITKCEDKCP